LRKSPQRAAASVNQATGRAIFVRDLANETVGDQLSAGVKGAGAGAGAWWASAGCGYRSAVQDSGGADRPTRPLLADDSVFAGRYRIVRLLGKGERKQIYLAWDTKASRQVALAIIDPRASLASTKREAEILGPVHQHSSIVTLYDFELEPGGAYMVFEYLSGGELRDLCRQLKSDGVAMALQDFFRLARQLCRALSHIHDHGIIHRDVSTSNIWLDERGEAHLGDFDTATSPQHPLSDDGSLSTYKAYAAPELRSGAAVDQRADIYALGAVLYEVLTGDRPALRAGSSSSVKPPSRFRDDLPAGMDRLLLSMLTPEPEQRPASASAVLQTLRSIQGRAADPVTLLADGESDVVEFKASLRTNVPGADVNKALEQVAIKTVAGFLNGRGGTLLIGVADDGSPVGLDNDYHSSPKIGGRDGFERKLRELLSSASGKPVQSFVTVAFHNVNHQDICRVAIEPAAHPIYVKCEGKTRFYLRTGNATNELAVDEAISYYSTRWS
jgi:serine/threonine protein kinase